MCAGDKLTAVTDTVQHPYNPNLHWFVGQARDSKSAVVFMIPALFRRLKAKIHANLIKKRTNVLFKCSKDV